MGRYEHRIQGACRLQSLVHIGKKMLEIIVLRRPARLGARHAKGDRFPVAISVHVCHKTLRVRQRTRLGEAEFCLQHLSGQVQGVCKHVRRGDRCKSIALQEKSQNAHAGHMIMAHAC